MLLSWSITPIIIIIMHSLWFKTCTLHPFIFYLISKRQHLIITVCGDIKNVKYMRWVSPFFCFKIFVILLFFTHTHINDHYRNVCYLQINHKKLKEGIGDFMLYYVIHFRIGFQILGFGNSDWKSASVGTLVLTGILSFTTGISESLKPRISRIRKFGDNVKNVLPLWTKYFISSCPVSLLLYM